MLYVLGKETGADVVSIVLTCIGGGAVLPPKFSVQVFCPGFLSRFSVQVFCPRRLDTRAKLGKIVKIYGLGSLGLLAIGTILYIRKVGSRLGWRVRQLWARVAGDGPTGKRTRAAGGDV